MAPAATPILAWRGRRSGGRLGPKVTGEGGEALTRLFWTEVTRRKDLPHGEGLLTTAEVE
jgi:hypothetical protein